MHKNVVAAVLVVLCLVALAGPVLAAGEVQGTDPEAGPVLDGEALALVGLLAVVTEVMVSYVLAPVRQRFPGLDLWWAPYVGLVAGGTLGWFAEVDLFAGVFSSPALGRAVTALLVGGGPTLVRQIVDAVAARVLHLDRERQAMGLESLAVRARLEGWAQGPPRPVDEQSGE